MDYKELYITIENVKVIKEDIDICKCPPLTLFQAGEIIGMILNSYDEYNFTVLRAGNNPQIEEYVGQDAEWTSEFLNIGEIIDSRGIAFFDTVDQISAEIHFDTVA